MRFRAASFLGAGLALSCLASSSPARAQQPPAAEPPAPPSPQADSVPPPAPRPRDVKEEVPALSYTTSAFGASRYTAGALSYVGVLGGASKSSMPSPGAGLLSDAGGTQLTAGARIWGSPVERLTIFLGVDRRYYDKAAPSISAMFRVAGNREKGWALSAMATYRTDGFSEFGGEVEGLVAFSVARSGFHLDSNVVFGGEPDGGDADGEVRLRAGYDVTRWLRVGADGQFRYRVAGDKLLPGGRVADAVAGPELLFGFWHFFGALSGGPTTVGVARGVGWTATTTLGGAYF